MAVIDSGSNAAGKANVDADNNLQVIVPGYGADGVPFGGGSNAGPALFSEVDGGRATGSRVVLSPEVDNDYRLRVAHDNLLDNETFNYTSQNTGKHSHAFTTLTATVSAAGLLTNSGNITTTTTGMTFGTFAEFPTQGTQTVACETSVAFTAQPNANTIIDFGLFRRGASTAFAPTDGVYFRMSAAGLQGVVNNSGTETTTAVFPLALGAGTYAYVNSEVHQYLIQMSNVSVTFWIDNILHGTIPTPTGYGYPVKSATLPWSIRHAIVGGAAGAATQALITDYRVVNRGVAFTDDLGVIGNRVYGAYQGLSGGTMGSLANYANSANPTAAVATNTTAALGTGLGGQFWETATLAVNTDGIICSYQVPAGTAAVPGRRLKITGVALTAYIQTAITGGPLVQQFSLAFGHTAVSLATGESASFATGTTKAARRIPLPVLTQAITAAQAVSTIVSQPGGAQIDFTNAPVYVNPGEFVAVVAKKVGTVITAGVIGYVIRFDYSWE
jgi:hypothetical protein